ncbi:hypothetical protein CCE24_25805 [Escherichia coli]|nr:hypothetical protein CCE24_25805 [Escherichia coli]OWG93875.1 hypothetical protein CCE15_25670 [Escherichia coli]OWH09799.1 hypothetical protein CCE22_25740 [Escherichia coli]OWH22770.1 hypothetical protein CCE09_25570 [Escherichia coli]
MNTDLVHVVFALCWVAFICFVGAFSYTFFKWLIYNIWPLKTVTVNHYHNGILIESRTLDLSSEEPLVRQLKKLTRGKPDE